LGSSRPLVRRRQPPAAINEDRVSTRWLEPFVSHSIGGQRFPTQEKALRNGAMLRCCAYANGRRRRRVGRDADPRESPQEHRYGAATPPGGSEHYRDLWLRALPRQLPAIRRPPGGSRTARRCRSLVARVLSIPIIPNSSPSWSNS